MFRRLFFIFICSLAFCDEPYPVVIIGGGIGGLSSSIYLNRAGIKPLIIEGKEPSQITLSYRVENWPGEEKISGLDLVEKLKNQSLKNGSIILSKEVVAIDLSKTPYEMKVKDILEDKIETILFKTCIIATGNRVKLLGVEGEKEYWGRGVSSCAICDGSFYKDKIVAVVGGSDGAIVEALYLSNLAKKVYVIVRDENFRAHSDKKNRERLFKKKNIEVLYKTNIISLLGDENALKELVIVQKGEKKKLEVDGLFLALGSKPNTDLFKGQLELDEKEFIILKNVQETSKKGIFAIGDVTSFPYKQAIFAASSGALAALQVEQILEMPSEIKIQEKKPVLSIVEITSLEQLEEELKNSSIPILIDFYAKWCAPCKRIAPLLEERAKELQDVVKIFKVNIESARAIAEKYSISKMPTFLLIDQKKDQLTKRVGSEEALKLLNELLNSKNSK